MQQWMQLRQDEFSTANWEEYVVLNLNKAPLVWDCFPNNSIKPLLSFHGEEGSERERDVVTSLLGLPYPPIISPSTSDLPRAVSHRRWSFGIRPK